MGKAFDGIWLFRGVEQTLQYGERVALVGPNGSGKTTLLRLILGEIQPDGGTVAVGPSVRIGYMPQQQEVLNPKESALETIQHLAAMNESEVFNFLQYFLIYDEKVRLPTASLSFGERSRLMLARLVVSGATACCWMSRSTTWISPRASSSRPRWRPSPARCWSRSTTGPLSTASRPACGALRSRVSARNILR